jgi:phosphohistidine phosphatase SixA
MLNRRMILAGLFAGGAEPGWGETPTPSPGLRALVEGGAVALLRHAAAPGTGDPPGFRLGDCATQRNLSETGRRQAAELGLKLRQGGVAIAEARSSRWCRALDTARLAFPDLAVEPDPALDSFFDDRASRDRQTEAARALVRSWQGRPGVLALITHQVNITALTEVFPAEGEIVVLRPTDMSVIGRVRFASR